jgi:uncharacterized SAM-dependent methyltransferase
MMVRPKGKKHTIEPWCFGSTRQADFRNAVTHAAFDLFARKQHGHLGDIAYLNGGGKLYEKFMRANDAYSLFSGEINNISANCRAIAADLAETERAIIVGPGPGSSFDQKEMQILKLLPGLKEVHFVDLNDEFNRQASRIVKDYARKNGLSIRIETHEMDFRNASSVIAPRACTAVLSTGSLVSNVPNAPLNAFPDYDTGQFIDGFAALAGDGGKVVLGYDSNDSAKNLEQSYNGDLAPFIENIMKIIVDHSRSIKGLDASKGSFRYESEWLKQAGQVAHKLIAEKDQTFQIHFEGKPHKFFIEKGDEFVVMSSLRPKVERLTKIAGNIGMQSENVYVSESGIVDQVFTVNKGAKPASWSNTAQPS